MYCYVPLLCYGNERRNTVSCLVHALKPLIIVPIESKNYLVQATFYKSHLKQLNVECTSLDCTCDFRCYIMAVRGEMLYHIWCMPLKLILIIALIKCCDDVVEATFYGSCQLSAMQESEIIMTC